MAPESPRRLDGGAEVTGSGEMGSSRWQRIQQAFDSARNAEPDRVEAVLTEHCGQDDELRREVISLLEASDGSDEFLAALAQRAGMPIGDTPPAPSLEGRRFGAYRLVKPIGQGGMGVVYLAERDDHQFEKQVAVKILSVGLGMGAARQRFLAERRFLARLEHPRIARLLDSGITEDGTPFFVMEYVEGEPIDRYCERLKLDSQARIELFLQVCEAVEYAHSNLVVHRDLKPANVLVTADGQAKLLDFGIAKALKAEGEDEVAMLTQVSGRPLTPAYASPEQIRGEPITTATDVYALGLLLYTLLAGRAPYETSDLSRVDLERCICSHRPEAPSVVTDAEGARARYLRGDLDTIVLKAIRKKPERRYPSVAALAGDLVRHRDGLPIQARPASFSYRTIKFMRRHPGAVAAGIAGLVILGVYVGTIHQHAIGLERERNVAEAALVRAEVERSKAEQVTAFLSHLLESADPEKARGVELTVREVLDQGLSDANRLPDEPEVRAELLSVMSQVYGALGHFEPAAELAAQALTLRREAHGEAHALVVQGLNLLGEMLHGKREPAAEQAFRDALALGRDVLGEEDPAIVRSLEGLAFALREAGQVPAAAVALEEAVRIQRSAANPDNLAVAASLRSLGRMLWYQFDYVGALRAYREEVEIRRRIQGGDELDLAWALHQLGNQLINTQDFKAAEAAYGEALLIRRRMLGDAHPHTLTTLLTMGMALRGLQDFEASEAFLREALEGRRKAFGPESEDVRDTIWNLARTLRDKGDYDGAERYFQQSLAILGGRSGENRLRIGQSIAFLGQLETVRGNPYRAVELLREGLAIIRDSQIPIATVQVVYWLGQALQATGELDEAAALFREGLSISREGPAEETLEIVTGMGLLATVLRAQGELDEAERLHRDCIRIIRRDLGSEHPWLASELLGLGGVHLDRGDLDTAETYYREGLEMQSRLTGQAVEDLEDYHQLQHVVERRLQGRDFAPDG